MKQKYNEPVFNDPVCGMEVSRSTAIDTLILDGKTYYFCATTCREAFEKKPGEFVRSHRQHGLRHSR